MAATCPTKYGANTRDPIRDVRHPEQTAPAFVDRLHAVPRAWVRQFLLFNMEGLPSHQSDSARLENANPRSSFFTFGRIARNLRLLTSFSARCIALKEMVMTNIDNVPLLPEPVFEEAVMSSSLNTALHVLENSTDQTTRTAAHHQFSASLMVSVALLAAAVFVGGQALAFEDNASPPHGIMTP
jgi:hypothetical protein